MYCSLAKPGERTTQEACTSGLQFSVSVEGGTEFLDLTIHQRSSDILLGLPHDVVVWSIIYHLVRREVDKRSGRHLAAGKIDFIIVRGGAHFYLQNKDALETLLSREPYLEVIPELSFNTDEGVFEIAQKFERKTLLVKGYTRHHKHIKIEQAV